MATLPLPAIVPLASADDNYRQYHDVLRSTAAAASTVPQFKQLHANILRSGVERSLSFLLSKMLSLPVSSTTSLDYVLAVFMYSPPLDPRFCHRALRAFSRAGDGPAGLS
ncbi:hypothetical protein HPP92_024841 [Vanilla planifolia]|uniref:Uncharacterized protein n=1 Tax=Vanilla planifolia TaxID=51239 RepID=A0A835PPT1_VANPL|nr:hypothetical protein HPP92_024841 [Vanilla planifolia]